MPYRKRKRGKYEKKGKVIIRKNNGLTICKVPSVCPDIMQVELTYNRTSGYNASAPVVQVFRGNSIFDPDFTGVGSQPMGHDQWATLYRRYRVIGSKITVRTNSLDGTDASGLVITPLNTSGIVSDPEMYIQGAYAAQGYNATTGDNSPQIVSNYITTSKMRGMPKDAFMYEDDLGAAVGSNPLKTWYWHVCWYNSSAVVNSINGTATVKIVYYVQFYDRETLSTS